MPPPPLEKKYNNLQDLKKLSTTLLKTTAMQSIFKAPIATKKASKTQFIFVAAEAKL